MSCLTFFGGDFEIFMWVCYLKYSLFAYCPLMVQFSWFIFVFNVCFQQLLILCFMLYVTIEIILFILHVLPCEYSDIVWRWTITHTHHKERNILWIQLASTVFISPFGVEIIFWNMLCLITQNIGDI